MLSLLLLHRRNETSEERDKPYKPTFYLFYVCILYRYRYTHSRHSSFLWGAPHTASVFIPCCSKIKVRRTPLQPSYALTRSSSIGQSISNFPLILLKLNYPENCSCLNFNPHCITGFQIKPVKDCDFFS